MIPIMVEPIIDEESGEERLKVNFDQWREMSMTMFHNWGQIRDFLMLTPEYGRKDVTMMKLVEQINNLIVSGVLLTTVLYKDIIIDPKFEEFIEKMKVMAAENTKRMLEENEAAADEVPPDIKDKIVVPGGTA